MTFVIILNELRGSIKLQAAEYETNNVIFFTLQFSHLRIGNKNIQAAC